MRVFHRELDHLSDQTVDTVLDQILDDALHLTTGQLSRRVSRLVMTADPDATDLAYQAGHADRKFVASANPDNTGNITGSGLGTHRRGRHRPEGQQTRQTAQKTW